MGLPRETSRRWLVRGVDVAFSVVATALAASLAYAAWHDVSQAYDVWYYHLPFAARLAGIMDASRYAFSADNAARYQGFPLLAEVLQGITWRATGHVQASNLVSLSALFGLSIFLRRLFAVPLPLSLLALLAIPLVHIHATAGYVDLFGNACATMLLLCTYRVVVEGRSPSPRFLVGCALLAAAAVNTKFQLVPIVVVSAAVLAWYVLRDLRSADAGLKERVRRCMVVLLVAIPVVFYTPIKNAARYGNPVWPVEIHGLGSLPFREAAYSQSPKHLADSPRPIRFARSVLEVDNLAITSQRRWSLDQYAPPDDAGCRMGGYFGAYVVVNLLALAWAALKRRTREAVCAACVFGGATVVAALVPQSHELRYYMFWMMFLVSLNLSLWTGSRERNVVVGAVATAALAVVAWSTDAGYLYASGSTLPEYLTKRVDRDALERAPSGERLCVAREPFTFLYAPLFHPEKRYSVQEATSAADCNGARLLDP